MKITLGLKVIRLKLEIFSIYSISDVGARNERRFCAVNCSKTPGFEVIHGLLDRVMVILDKKPTQDKKVNPNEGYHIAKGEGEFCL